MKFRKKPVEIEAIQWTGKNAPEILSWCGQYHQAGGDKSAFINEQGELKIRTLEGEHLATINDWIIKGVSNEFYPCKPDIFEKTYDRVWPAPQSPPKVDRPVA